jgi:ABC-2 type transport system ATP-binding protein
MLRARGLVVRYGPRAAVSGVDLELGEHEILGLLGPNGAGKSTLLRRLAGLIHAQEGSVDLGGADPAVDARARARIGYLPEDAPLYPEDTALQYVAYLAALSGVRWRKRRAAAAQALERTGAAPLAQRLCGRLSKGQRQRVAMAGAIVHRPDVLLLDEPSEGLDPRQMMSLRKLLDELRTTTSIVFSTHLLGEAQTVCDRVVVIDQGRVALERSLRGVVAGHRVRVVAHGVKPGQLNEALLAVPGVRRVERGICTVDGPAVAEAIAAAVCARGWRLRLLAPVPDDLEAAFLAAVTQAPAVVAEPGRP